MTLRDFFLLVSWLLLAVYFLLRLERTWKPSFLGVETKALTLRAGNPVKEALIMNLPDHRFRRWSYGLIPAESYSLPHAHAQATKTYYKHQDSRIKKAKDQTKTKTFATLIFKIFLKRYQDYQGRLLASFQVDAKYEHVGQDTRSQDGKDLKVKDLKISEL
ncbi:hypothetical protein Tco_0929622 [Tanacetum coccineum]